MTVVRAVLSAEAGGVAMAEIELRAPGPGEVRVAVAVAGVCHSDLSLVTGALPHRRPMVPGHEAAGVVAGVGPGVERVAVGDRVVLSWRPACGACRWCAVGQPYLCASADDAGRRPFAHTAAGDAVFPGLGVAAFAEQTVVPEAAVFPLACDIPLETAALLGCAAITGFGAVRNCARVRPGETVVVVGAGGVGSFAIQTARSSGAGAVIAVDLDPAAADRAIACGATDFLLAADDPVADVLALTGGAGADHAIECVGLPETITTAWAATRRGGVTTVVGAGGRDALVSFSALELFHSARTLVGCLGGNADLGRDLPELADWVRAGRIDPGLVVAERIALADVPAALDRLAGNRGNGRSLVVY